MPATNGKLTVSELIAALQTANGDAYVVLDDGEGWYNHVSQWEIPDNDLDESAGYIAFTLYQGDDQLSPFEA